MRHQEKPAKWVGTKLLQLAAALWRSHVCPTSGNSETDIFVKHQEFVKTVSSPRLYWLTENAADGHLRAAAKQELRWRSDHFAHFVKEGEGPMSARQYRTAHVAHG